MIRNRVAVVAASQTHFSPDRRDASIGELVWEVTEQILAETDLTFEAQGARPGRPVIDKIISCSEDFWQGRTISDMFCHLEMGALGMSLTKTAADGASAVIHGVVSILSGKHDIVLVVAHRKESETERSVIENAALDPIYLRPLGMDSLHLAAMAARRYMDRFGVSVEQCARVVVQSRSHARANPCAQESGKIGIEEVLGSSLVASPLHQLDCKPTSDGAAALILASGERAREISERPVWITGIGNCYDAHYPGDRELSDCESLHQASRKAYAMAGVTDPWHQLDVAEISAEYSFQELLWMEGLGFCPRGKAAGLVEAGQTTTGGQLPINPSGGVLAGNPSGVAGLTRVVETYLQLSGQAGDRAVPGATLGLAHGCYGPAGQAHSVLVLSHA